MRIQNKEKSFQEININQLFKINSKMKENFGKLRDCDS